MGTDKALLPWPPKTAGATFLSAAIQALSPFTELIIVVAGKNEANLTPIVDANGAFLVVNPEPERGQFSSLQCGLHEVLNRGRDAAMVTLVDRPPAQASTLDQLRTAFYEAVSVGKWAVVPEYGGQHGHPILIGREMIEAFLKAAPNANARDIQRQNQARIKYFPVDDPFITMNVDTPDGYARLKSEPVQSGG
jgi:molybdenum cofactor cytidylyltransferase